tara:strand:- start:77 stop:682 length:606 start_codon:yes stop_codon:yes gene_type:complete
MKTFREFILEVYDPEIQGRSQIRRQGQGGRVGPERKKTEPEKRRVKAVGGGKTVPAADYKPRKDIGTQRPKSTTEQQPTRERGSASLSPREAQRKAAMERRARKSSGAGARTDLKGKSTSTSKDKEKVATNLLRQKDKAKVDPKYKPQKASGLTHRERLNMVKKGEKKLRDLRLQSTGKTKESELKYPITQKEVTRRNKKK